MLQKGLGLDASTCIFFHLEDCHVEIFRCFTGFLDHKVISFEILSC